MAKNKYGGKSPKLPKKKVNKNNKYAKYNAKYND